ncbi:MAG: PDDEXK nuclease domain-containing protein [Methanoregula sp.]|nr:PDDEXK nuclease domain-containing protein [Methanoregula sp.]
MKRQQRPPKKSNDTGTPEPSHPLIREPEGLDLPSLVRWIADIHYQLVERATKAVNVSLTLRNWLIGRSIQNYELEGKDRATYGDRLFSALANDLTSRGVSNCSPRQLYRYRDFYLAYPYIVGTLSPQLLDLLPEKGGNREIVGTLYPQSGNGSQDLLQCLSYSHFQELVAIEDPLKRSFYEGECTRGNWSGRELQRQISSLYYERTALSKNKKRLTGIVSGKAESINPAQVIRDPYIFEFLGLHPHEALTEQNLEGLLINRLQEFLLELGRGFCFEARQKRILIGGEHFFVDLVFYHRILKCHVLIELKVDTFSHEYLGQLNTYVNWFRLNEMICDDNPPIGILLCTRKNEALVEYALAGMDNQLFVSKYQVELPQKEEIRKFIEEQILNEGDMV